MIFYSSLLIAFLACKCLFFWVQFSDWIPELAEFAGPGCYSARDQSIHAGAVEKSAENHCNSGNAPLDYKYTVWQLFDMTQELFCSEFEKDNNVKSSQIYNAFSL